MAVQIEMYMRRGCMYCVRARALLEQKGVPFSMIGIDGDVEKEAEMIDRAGSDLVPQIFVGDRHIGGCDELYELEREGSLDPLLGLDSAE